jgi:hypothetical protein
MGRKSPLSDAFLKLAAAYDRTFCTEANGSRTEPGGNVNRHGLHMSIKTRDRFLRDGIVAGKHSAWQGCTALSL